MFQRFSLALAVCLAFGTASAHAQDMASKIIKHFPGKWELKDVDGTALGDVHWKVVAGGKAIAGEGKMADGISHSMLAGWDAARKIWHHIYYRENGEFGRLFITKLEGDTYHGEVSRTDSSGKVVHAKWENKVVDENHFVVTEHAGDEQTVIHFYRVGKPKK